MEDNGGASGVSVNEAEGLVGEVSEEIIVEEDMLFLDELLGENAQLLEPHKEVSVNVGPLTVVVVPELHGESGLEGRSISREKPRVGRGRGRDWDRSDRDNQGDQGGWDDRGDQDNPGDRDY
ncbi:unnamed protein product [Calypogeia fissa]